MVRYGFHNTPALTAVQRGSSRCHSDSAAICNLATLFCQEEYNSHNPRKVSNLSCAGLRAALDDTTRGIQAIFTVMPRRLAKADRHAEGKVVADYVLRTSVTNVM